MKKVELGQTVSIKGLRSNNNGRLRASGKIVEIKSDGSVVVQAGVQYHGLQRVHVHVRDLVF